MVKCESKTALCRALDLIETLVANNVAMVNKWSESGVRFSDADLARAKLQLDADRNNAAPVPRKIVPLTAPNLNGHVIAPDIEENFDVLDAITPPRDVR